jgi:hypothetical protein
MHLSNWQILSCLLMSFTWTFEVGSISTTVMVVVSFALASWVAAIVPAATFLTRLPKWILVLVSTGLLIAQAIFTFGSPLAGIIYWLSWRLAAAVLLPMAMILLVIGLFRGQSPRVLLPQICICALLGILCLITR